MCKNGLIRKMRVLSKFMMSQPGKQKMAAHILPNISRSESNQAMKFGKLIKYSMRKNLLEKSYTKTTPRPFSVKAKLSISLDQ